MANWSFWPQAIVATILTDRWKTAELVTIVQQQRLPQPTLNKLVICNLHDLSTKRVICFGFPWAWGLGLILSKTGPKIRKQLNYVGLEKYHVFLCPRCHCKSQKSCDIPPDLHQQHRKKSQSSRVKDSQSIRVPEWLWLSLREPESQSLESQSLRVPKSQVPKVSRAHSFRIQKSKRLINLIVIKLRNWTRRLHTNHGDYKSQPAPYCCVYCPWLPAASRRGGLGEDWVCGWVVTFLPLLPHNVLTRFSNFTFCFLHAAEASPTRLFLWTFRIPGG